MGPFRQGRRKLAGCAVVLALVAACSGPARGAGRSPAPASPTVEPSTAPGERCDDGALALEVVGPVGGGAGHSTLALELVNRSRERCWLEGVPAVRLLTGQGQAIAATAVTDPSVPPSQVVLPPGAGAVFLVTVEIRPSARQPSCPEAASAQVTAPGGGASLSAGQMRLTVCGSEFEVSALEPSGALKHGG
ncbi:MAG TPA: DUF4232 domain-containing protein [Candidatus Dormibacteraeota bacterium]|nr:DUF4232 domain-containing protein [Candidatus Dormibacteraeota bacterium]